MKNQGIALILIFSLIFSHSCIKDDDFESGNLNPIKGRGPVVSEERVLSSSINAVSSQMGADVNIIASDENYIVINAQENLHQYIKTFVKSGELRIYTGLEGIETRKPITIDVYTSKIKRLSLTGAGNIISDLPLNEINLSGAGYIYSKGEVEYLNVTISGSGNLDLFDMPVQKAKVSIMGTGSVNVYTTESLNVNIMGIGNVYFKGNPVVNQNIFGMGSVIDSN
ncbi:MAG: head GIN domain-containing protein [Bacteroidales bacterium]